MQGRRPSGESAALGKPPSARRPLLLPAQTPGMRLAGRPPTVLQRSSGGTRGQGSLAAHRERPPQHPRAEESGAACPSYRRGRRGRRRDPRASGAPRPRRAAPETFRHGSPRTPTGGHQAALSVVLFCAELPSDSFPSRAKRSDSEAAGWLSQANSAVAPPPKALAPVRLAEGAFPPDLPRWVRAHHECAPPRQTGQEPISEIATVCFPAHAWRRRADHERRSRGETRSAPIRQGAAALVPS